MKQEESIWKRMNFVHATAEELGVKLHLGDNGWSVGVPHFNGASLDRGGRTLGELEQFLKGLGWGLRYAKFKNGEKDE